MATRSQRRCIPFLTVSPPLGFRLLKRPVIPNPNQEDPIIPNSSDPIFEPPNTKLRLPPIGHERRNKKNGDKFSNGGYRLFEAAGIVEEKPLMALLQVLSRINPNSGFRVSKQSGEEVRVRKDDDEVEGEEIVWKGPVRPPMVAPPLGFRLLKRPVIPNPNQEDPIIPNSSDPIFEPPNTKPRLPPIGHERRNKKTGEFSNGGYRLFEAVGIVEEKPLMALLQVLSRINPNSGFRVSKQSGEEVRVRKDDDEVEGEEIVWKGPVRPPMVAPPLGFRLLKRSEIQFSTQEDPIIPNSSDPVFEPPNTKSPLPPIGYERRNKKTGELSNCRNYRLFEAVGTVEEKPLMALLQVLSRINPSSGFRVSKQSGEQVRVRKDEDEVEGEEIVWKGLSYM